MLLTAAAGPVLSQGPSAVPDNVRAQTTFDRFLIMNAGEIRVGIPMPPKKLIGDGYLDTRWHNASFMLYGMDKMIEGYPARYDLLNREMEVRTKSGVKVIIGKKIRTFVWMDSVTQSLQYFVNGQEFKDEDGGAYDGFFYILADGKCPLLKRTEAVLKKATYTVQFDVGSKDDQIIKKEKLFYRSADGNVLQLPNSRKKIFAIFGDSKEVMEKFADDNQLSVSEERHLINLFQRYNTINSGS
jgi:hypothetical protein